MITDGCCWWGCCLPFVRWKNAWHHMIIYILAFQRSSGGIAHVSIEMHGDCRHLQKQARVRLICCGCRWRFPTSNQISLYFRQADTNRSLQCFPCRVEFTGVLCSLFCETVFTFVMYCVAADHKLVPQWSPTFGSCFMSHVQGNQFATLSWNDPLFSWPLATILLLI